MTLLFVWLVGCFISFLVRCTVDIAQRYTQVNGNLTQRSERWKDVFIKSIQFGFVFLGLTGIMYYNEILWVSPMRLYVGLSLFVI